MGKGDRRTRRGKIWARSYGKSRPRPGKKTKEAPEATTTES
ncbi:MAG: 30S ribosomal protein THX [Isosphaeraceae bacterium]